MNDNAKWYLLVRRWIRRDIRSRDFIEMASWIERKSDAVHLVHRMGSNRSINLTIARAFLAAAKE